MRVIFKRIIFGVVFGMALFFLNINAYALTLDGSIADETQIFNSNVYTSIDANNSNSPHSVSKIFDINYSNSSNHDYMIFPLVGVMFQRYFQDGTVVNSSNGQQDYFSNRILNQFISIKLIPTAGQWVSCEMQNNFIVCPMLPNVTYKGLEFILSNPFLSSNDTFYLTLTLNRYAWIYDKDNKIVANAIQQQTDDIQNSDAPASATYNNDYSTQSYDHAESSVNSSMNVDVSNFVFNPSQWISAFNWIWQVLTSFVQINGKVFATITSFLTFSFVGLVIGRS